MHKLRLDYQCRSKPFPVAGALLLAGAMATSLLTTIYYQGVMANTLELEASLGRFKQASVSQVKPAYPEKRKVGQDVSQANEVLRQLTLPWENLFQALESAIDPEVTLLGMRPDIEKHVVDISCEAKNLDAMLNFVKRLKERSEFSSVYLQSHQIQEMEPQKPVRFSLIAVWRNTA